MLKQDHPVFHGVHAPGVAVVPEARGTVPLLVDEVDAVAPAALRLRRAHRERRQGAYKERPVASQLLHLRPALALHVQPEHLEANDGEVLSDVVMAERDPAVFHGGGEHSPDEEDLPV